MSDAIPRSGRRETGGTTVGGTTGGGTTGGGLPFVANPQLRAQIEQARIHILLEHPFMAAAVMGIPVIELPLPNAGRNGGSPSGSGVSRDRRLPDGFGTNGRAILVDEGALSLNPVWVREHYLHNLVHCLFEHLSRRGTRRPDVWNAAIDVATTALIQSFMPQNARYGLDHDGKSDHDAGDPEPRDHELGSHAEGTHAAGFSRARSQPVAPRDRFLEDAVDYWGQSSCEQIYESFLKFLEPLKDPHEPQGEDGPIASILAARGSDSGHREHAGGHVQSSMLPTPDELAEICYQVYGAAKLHGRSLGTEPGRWRERACPQRSRPVDWRRVFAERLSSLVPYDYRSYPFAKRHLWRGILLPSVGGRSAGRVLFAVDTSASMDIAVLGQIVDQLDQLRQTTGCSITLVHFDSALQKEVDLDDDGMPNGVWGGVWGGVCGGVSGGIFGGIAAASDTAADVLEMCGRGGTDLSVPFDVLERRTRASDNFVGMVVATDGNGPLPSREPHIPTVWLVPECCVTSFTPPFGTVIACTPSASTAR